MKIMLVLTRTLGDIVLVNSLTKSIKNWYGQDSEIHLFVNPEWSQIVRNNPDIAKVHDETQWHSNWFAVQKEMLIGGYDEVMIANQTSQEDNAWHQFPELREQHLYDFYVNRCRIPKGSHVDKKLRMYPSAAEREMLPVKLREMDIDIESGVKIGIHTKSGNPFKDITVDQWKKIIDELYPLGARFFQLGHPDDTSIYTDEDKSLLASRPGVFTDLRGKLTINEIYLTMGGHLDAFMGLDSGLSYVAAASGKTTFVWYGCTIPMTSGPWGENVHAYVSKECSVAQSRNHVRCHSSCGAKPTCMQLLSIKDAIAFAKERLNLNMAVKN